MIERLNAEERETLKAAAKACGILGMGRASSEDLAETLLRFYDEDEANKLRLSEALLSGAPSIVITKVGEEPLSEQPGEWPEPSDKPVVVAAPQQPDEEQQPQRLALDSSSDALVWYELRGHVFGLDVQWGDVVCGIVEELQGIPLRIFGSRDAAADHIRTGEGRWAPAASLHKVAP